MKSIKLLLLSSTITLISATIIQPVIAKPTMTVHYLKVSSEQIAATQQALPFNTSFSSLPVNPLNRIITQQANNIDRDFSHKISSRLQLSSIRKTAEQLPKKHMNRSHDDNSFFETAMIFNDKMQQVISYFKNQNSGLTLPASSLQNSHQVEIKNQQKECDA